MPKREEGLHLRRLRRQLESPFGRGGHSTDRVSPATDKSRISGGKSRNYGPLGAWLALEMSANATIATRPATYLPTAPNAGEFIRNSLETHIEFWEGINAEPYILSVIRDGYVIQIPKNFVPPEPQGPRSSVLKNWDFVIAEITKNKSIGVISACSNPQVVSPLHVVSSGEKKRLILDLSGLNCFLETNHFKLESWNTAWPFLEKARFACTFDFRAGYHHVKMSQRSSDFLAFSLDSPPKAPFWKFTALPFGLSTAPWLFTKIFKPLLARWRSRGIKVFLYLDDGLILAETEKEAERAGEWVREDLESAGVQLAPEKCSWSPSSRFVWLGYECDLERGTVSPTESRLDKTEARLEELIDGATRPTVLSRQRFLGSIASMFVVLGDQGVARSRALLNSVAVAQRSSRSDEWSMELSADEQRELRFWKENLRGMSVRAIKAVFCPDWQVYCDASAFGVGAVLKDAMGVVRDRVSQVGGKGFENESSAERELKAVKFAISEWREMIEGSVEVLSDSQAAVAILRKGSMTASLHSLAREVWELLGVMRDAQFTWIPRGLNTEADEASRDLDFDDWGLDWSVVNWAQSEWGEIKCDWFADETNRKCNVFFSRTPSGTTRGTNVFDHGWRAAAFGLAWWVPPPVLVPRLIQTARAVRAKGILGIPKWTGHTSFQAVTRENGDFISEIKAVRVFPKNSKIICPGRGSEKVERFSSPFCRSDFLLLLIDFSV